MIRHEVVGLVYTRKCPLACRHCITESSPSAKGKMRLEQAKQYLPILARFTSSISFTGGEPLLYHKEIVQLAEYATQLGLGVRIVTGAGWVRDERTAHRKVSELAQAGVSGMTISSDGYHEEFSPRERAVLLARLAVAAGLDVRVNVVVPADATSDDACRSDFAGLPVKGQPVQLMRLGMARTLPLEQFHWTDGPPKGPCGAVLKAEIDYDGTVYACCGPSTYSAKTSPLVLGNAEAEPLEDILERAIQDPILEVISLIGPYGLYHLLQGYPAGRAVFHERAKYFGICDLCLDITNSPALIAAIRERLHDFDARALVAAARMWHVHGKPAVA